MASNEKVGWQFRLDDVSRDIYPILLTSVLNSLEFSFNFQGNCGDWH